MSQNIYDNEVFFKGYIGLREGSNFNDILEQPAIQSLIPDVKEFKVLDLGCGFGTNTIKFAQEGAASVLGIDISKKMLRKAEDENSHPNVRYQNLRLEDLHLLKGKYDLIYSSLAFHYVGDFNKLIRDIKGLLKENGLLIYSQEHPIDTATLNLESFYTYDERQEASYYSFSNYGESGKRVSEWFVEGVENYHRPMSDIVSTLGKYGFLIETMIEPIPSEEQIQKHAAMKKNKIKPTFLIIRARKIKL